MKKLLSVILAIVLLLSAVPFGFPVSAATEYTDGDYTYTLSNGKATITKVSTTIRGNINIPDTLGGYSVVAIGNHAFYECTNLTGITIPESITKIDVSAFYGCYRLVNINIPDSVTSIDGAVFHETAYYYDINNWENGVLYIGNHLIEAKSSVSGEYTIKDGTKTIAAFAFSECENVTRINIPNGVTSICHAAFINCFNLVDIIVPDSITTIEDSIIGNCYNLAGIYYMGSKEQRNNIAIGQYNSQLFKVTWYYNSCIGAEWHTYDDCDTTCNVCGFDREAWQIKPLATGVYYLRPSHALSELDIDSITVYDNSEKLVKYNYTKLGWPLVAGQTYTVLIKKVYSDIDKLSWILIKKADTIFPDTDKNGWYNDAVTYVVGSGIMSGYASSGKFGTSDNIQRQDFLVMLARLDGVDLTSYGQMKSKFPDVAEGSYFEAAVNWGASKGIVGGYDNGKFGTGDKITREQLVTFIYRYANYKDLDIGYTSVEKNKVKNTYGDYKNVTAFAQDAIIWAVTKGVIKGKDTNTLAPQGNAQRCEVAQIMYNMFLNDILKTKEDDSSLEGTKIIFASTVDLKNDGTDYVVSEFEKKYGIDVQIIVPTLENYCAEIQALIAAGKSPTVGRSAGDAPAYVGYFQPLDVAKIDYEDPIWDQRMFKLSTHNGSPYLCNTLDNFWTEADIVVYSKSLLKKANLPTPEELDTVGNWTFDSYLMIGQKTAALEGCEGASFSSYDTLLHMLGGAVYRTDINNRMTNGIDSKTTAIFQKVAQGFKDNGISFGSTRGLINGTVSITTTSMWSLRIDGNLVSHPNWNDLGFYYLPPYEKGGDRPVTGQLRGWGIIKGCNENPETGSKAAEAGGLFLREYLDVTNYSLDTSFISEEAKAFFFKMCSLYAATDNYNPYYTTYNLNEGISGIDDDKEVYSAMYADPAQISSMMSSIKAVVDMGVTNLNKYIEQYT